MDKLIYNAVECKKCKDVVESWHTHDFKMCSCNTVGCDGGLSYGRIIGNLDNMNRLHLTIEAPFEEIRNVFKRYNKFSNKYVSLINIEDEWLDNIIDWYIEDANMVGYDEVDQDYVLLYIKEKQYRFTNLN